MPLLKFPSSVIIPNHLYGADLDNFVAQNYPQVVGIDEVGRGCLAGPVISCAIILKPSGFHIKNLNDSKQLTEAKRLAVFPEILQHTQSLGIGTASVEEIDQINIFEATKLSMFRAIYNLEITQESYIKTALLVDGLSLLHPHFLSFKLIKGDTKSPSIMAASIIAKVVRDRLMQIYHKRYPQYDFHKNKGYGTAFHKKQIENGHYSPIHRKSFLPLKNILGI